MVYTTERMFCGFTCGRNVHGGMVRHYGITTKQTLVCITVYNGLDHRSRKYHGMYHDTHHWPIDCAMTLSMRHVLPWVKTWFMPWSSMGWPMDGSVSCSTSVGHLAWDAHDINTRVTFALWIALCSRQQCFEARKGCAIKECDLLTIDE